MSVDKLEDVILCIDTSGSMCNADYPPSRIECAKSAALEFVDTKRGIDPNDRIGVVTFSDFATEVVSVTNVRSKLYSVLGKINAAGSTALGDALVLSMKSLDDSRKQSPEERLPRIILLSDGCHNSGKASPEEAIRKAQKLGIIIDTIGIGDKKHSEFCEKTLRRIADMTRGEYTYITARKQLIRRYHQLARKKMPGTIGSPIVDVSQAVAAIPVSQPSFGTQPAQGYIQKVPASPSESCFMCDQKLHSSTGFRCTNCGNVFDVCVKGFLLHNNQCPACGANVQLLE